MEALRRSLGESKPARATAPAPVKLAAKTAKLTPKPETKRKAPKAMEKKAAPAAKSKAR
jgi:hypothetical protein